MRVSGASYSTSVKAQVGTESARTDSADASPSPRHPPAGGAPIPVRDGAVGHETAGVATGSSVANIFDGIALLEIALDTTDRMIATLREAQRIAAEAEGPAETEAQRRGLDTQLHERITALDTLAAQAHFKGYALLDGHLGCALFYTRRAPRERLCINFSVSQRAARLGQLNTAVSARLGPVFAPDTARGSYTTPPVRDLNFFSAPRHVELIVDGIAVPLQQDWSRQPVALAEFVESRLNAGRPEPRYRVTHAQERLTISTNRGPAPEVTSPSLNGIWFLGGTTVRNPVPPALTLKAGDLTLRDADRPPFDITGSFTSPEALASAIDAQLTHARALLTPDHRVMITSAQPFSVTGHHAIFPRGPARPRPAGNLTDCRLLEAAGRCQTTLRLGAAMQTLGARRDYFAKTLKRFYAELHAQTRRRYSHTATHPDPASASDNAARTGHLIRRHHAHAVQSLSRMTAATTRLLLEREHHAQKLTFCLAQCEPGNGICD